jgi:hexosaminidase
LAAVGSLHIQRFIFFFPDDEIFLKFGLLKSEKPPSIMQRELYLTLLIFASFINWTCKTQESASDPEPDIELIWSHDGNQTSDGLTTHNATFQLVNHGSQPLGDTGWTIYWNQMPNFVTASTGKLEVKNINGDFYKMTPLRGFSLAPGDTAVTTCTSQGFIIKITDSQKGPYIAWQTGNKEKTVPISRFTVLPFDRHEQYTRSPDDMEPYPDAAFLFKQNERLTALSAGQAYPFIPVPKSWVKGSGEFKLPAKCRIACSPGLEAEGKFLAGELKRRFGTEAVLSKTADRTGDIVLLLSPDIAGEEGYKLVVNEKGATITGKSAAGTFYGAQSLMSLVKKTANGTTEVTHCTVEDSPAFGYRGLHLDVSRNFQSKETVLRMLDLMARYKLNRLLFNITEDEGWRLEIKGLPELTEVGSRRGHLHRDSLCLQPAYGSGPDPNDPESHGNGHYTREEFKEIIRYAQERHISVIPEINLPGHARAAIKAMELRYHRLMAAGKQKEALQFRLIDPADTSRYISAQGYTDNTTCVCQDQVIRFFEFALDDIIAMYKEANVPLDLFHTGGDEVPYTAWTGSPICKEFLKKHPEIGNTRNLQGLFFGQMVDILQRKGLKTGAWEEAVMLFEGSGNNDWKPNPAFVGKEVYPYIWNNLWGNQDLGYRLANAGYPVILCNVTNFYFDLAYNKDPREPGLYWGGFVDTEDAFSFVAYDLFQSTRTDNMGRPFNPAKDFAGMQRLTPAGRKNIAGLQAQIWSETIKGSDMLEYYYLPKLTGFAQRAWQGDAPWSTKGEEERLADWNRFMNTVALIELPFLEDYQGGYNYRIPPPGILEENGQIKMNTGYPGFTIRFTTDGTEPTNGSPVYQNPMPAVDKPFKAACFNGKGRSGLVTAGPVKN